MIDSGRIASASIQRVRWPDVNSKMSKHQLQNQQAQSPTANPDIASLRKWSPVITLVAATAAATYDEYCPIVGPEDRQTTRQARCNGRMAGRERIQISDRSEEIEAKDAIIDERTGTHSAEDALQEVCAEPGHSAGADHKERVFEYPAVAKHQPISEQDDEC